MVTSGTQIAGLCVRTVSHLCLNSDYCIDSHFCIVGYVKRLASLAVMTMPATVGFGVGQATIATHARAQIGAYAAKGQHSGCLPYRLVAKRR